MAQAHAPYNFVPLNEKQNFLPVDKDNIPKHDRYYEEHHTGHFDVTLTAETPLFVRGMLDAEDVKYNNTLKDKSQHRKQSRFFMPDGNTPVIPGSSLRGMIRNLYEIVTFGKIHFVSDSNKIFFRAVAAKRDDPLGQDYKQVIGSFGRNVRAGFLENRGGKWYVRPAQKIGRDDFAKVKDRTDIIDRVQGLKRFNSNNYEVQYHDVIYTMGKKFINAVATPEAGQPATAVLVCTGNMLETNSGGTSSPRKNYSLVSRRVGKERLRIPDHIVRDYIDGLSPFQKEGSYFDSERGVLQSGYPVFFISAGNEVLRFGHTPNFRIAHLTDDTDYSGKSIQRAVTPADRIPAHLKDEDVLDFTDAVFGFVYEKRTELDKARAGRIAVTSAKLVNDVSTVDDSRTITRTPGSPKPTTFQHYLEQPHGTNTRKSNLHHYGNKRAKLRGHKIYWRRKVTINKLVDDNPNPEDINENVKADMQPITSISNDKLQFTFRVYFENLTDAELGALAWVMTLGGDADARHMLGMGKPYGMGVVKLDTTMTLSNRKARYSALFDGGGWQLGESKNQDMSNYIQIFKTSCPVNDFDDHPRIKELMAMLKLYNPNGVFEYMQIEGPRGNEYKDRPVLPSPTEVSQRL